MAIEKCLYCGETHDVGDGHKFHGVVVKECPKHPHFPATTFIDKSLFETIDKTTKKDFPPLSQKSFSE